MIKIISKERYDDLKQENLLLKIRLNKLIDSYNNYSFNQLSKLRKEMINEIKSIDKKMKETTNYITKSSCGGGNYKV